MSVEEKLEGEDIQMGEIHEEGKVRRVEHRTSQEARRTSGKRKRVHRGRLGMKQGPQGRGGSRSEAGFQPPPRTRPCARPPRR